MLNRQRRILAGHDAFYEQLVRDQLIFVADISWTLETSNPANMGAFLALTIHSAEASTSVAVPRSPPAHTKLATLRLHHPSLLLVYAVRDTCRLLRMKFKIAGTFSSAAALTKREC